MPITDAGNIANLISNVAAMQGFVALYGPTGSGPNWKDQMAGSTDHMIPTGGASHDGEKAIFDGSGHFATAGIPSRFAGFAGLASDQDSFNGSGFTVVMVAKWEPGTLASTVLIQWENTLDNTNILFRFNAAGKLQIWARSASQGGTYLTNPPSDRFVTFDDDLRPLLEDGQPHLLVLSRGTTHPPERKFIMIDGEVIQDNGSGNGIDLFSNWDVAPTIGRAATTTITGDPAFTNLNANVWALGIRKRYTPPTEADVIWRTLTPRRARPRHALYRFLGRRK